MLRAGTEVIMPAGSVEVSTFEFVRDLLQAEAGIVLEPGKEYLVHSRLSPVAKRAGLSSITEIVKSIRCGRAVDLRREVVDAMTTNETTFFRDVEPFEALRTSVLPQLIDARARSKQLRIWYAASSTGQEPYSVSMIIHDQFPELLEWRLEQLATDISRHALERARAGRYSQLEVNRGMPTRLLVKYFQRQGLEWQIAEPIRRMVKFEELNLNGPWPALPAFDIIFVRNVMIYFDVPAKKRILGRVHDLVQPDGFVFLGGAETTFNLEDRFTRAACDRGGCYTRMKQPLQKREP